MLSWMFGEPAATANEFPDLPEQGAASTGELKTRRRQPLAQRFQCAIWHDGLFSIPTFFLESDLCMGGPDFGGAPYPWRQSGDDAATPSALELLQKWNPADPRRLSNWRRNAPPTLVVHSERDYRCPMTEGLGMFKALQAMGVVSRFVTFPDECHFVEGKENTLAWYGEIEGWLARWLRPRRE